ncbi:MAG: dihydrofolate reductase family protein [Candidatus Paceibacterota bacterium]|jgi:dihydrofolate reductase
MNTFIIVAHTADGIIAKQSNKDASSTTWTSNEDRKHFVSLTKNAGVIVMGLTTFNTIGKPLPKRLNVVYAPKGTPEIPGVELTDKSPQELLKDLEARGHTNVAICGGSTIYTMFMEANCVDKIYITIEPKLFGSGMTIFNKPLDINLSLLSVQNLSKDVLALEYQVVKE